MERKFRIITKRDFQKVLKNPHPQKIASKSLVLYYSNTNFNHPRFGVIISKKNFKKATTRNYYKRVIKEAIWITGIKQFPIKDYVVIISKNIANNFVFASLLTEFSVITNKLSKLK